MSHRLVARIIEGSETLIDNSEALSQVLSEAGSLSRRLGKLGVITLESKSGALLALVVGGDESVLAFQEKLDPPYYASRGASEAEQPVMECLLHFAHHTEFARSAVVPMSVSENAAFEFLETAQRPRCVQWQEV